MVDIEAPMPSRLRPRRLLALPTVCTLERCAPLKECVKACAAMLRSKQLTELINRQWSDQFLPYALHLGEQGVGEAHGSPSENERRFASEGSPLLRRAERVRHDATEAFDDLSLACCFRSP